MDLGGLAFLVHDLPKPWERLGVFRCLYTRESVVTLILRTFQKGLLILERPRPAIVFTPSALTPI